MYLKETDKILWIMELIILRSLQWTIHTIIYKMKMNKFCRREKERETQIGNCSCLHMSNYHHICSQKPFLFQSKNILKLWMIKFFKALGFVVIWDGALPSLLIDILRFKINQLTSYTWRFLHRLYHLLPCFFSFISKS